MFDAADEDIHMRAMARLPDDPGRISHRIMEEMAIVTRMFVRVGFPPGGIAQIAEAMATCHARTFSGLELDAEFNFVDAEDTPND